MLTPTYLLSSWVRNGIDTVGGFITILLALAKNVSFHMDLHEL